MSASQGERGGEGGATWAFGWHVQPLGGPSEFCFVTVHDDAGTGALLVERDAAAAVALAAHLVPDGPAVDTLVKQPLERLRRPPHHTPAPAGTVS